MNLRVGKFQKTLNESEAPTHLMFFEIFFEITARKYGLRALGWQIETILIQNADEIGFNFSGQPIIFSHFALLK